MEGTDELPRASARATAAPRLRATARADAAPRVLVAAAAATVLAGVVLRFWTRSHLWLDEALTVNIARLSWGRIVPALRHDGAPPLYYFLLHAWMLVFGTGNESVRALSGVFAVAALPLLWVAGRRLGGPAVAAAGMLLLATSPFAVHYATETRMYSLVVLLTVIGYLVLDRVLRRPTVPSAVGLAVVTALLLLTHYWALYLLASVGALLVWRLWRGERQVWWALAGLAGGVVLFVPWLPTFAFQLRHTGTPWAEPASFSAMVNAISEFSGGGTSPGRALGLLFFALAGFGLLGVGIDGTRIELDLRTRPRARGVAFVSLVTLFLAITVGLVTRAAFAARYTSVVLAVFLLLVALGTTVLVEPRVRWGVLALAVVLGLAGAAKNVTTDRTEAGKLARAIATRGHAGDVVAYCPDQLGPSVDRVLPAGFVELTYPFARPPQRVDWVDYAARMRASKPGAFARLLVDRAGTTHDIWLVWSGDYRSVEAKCQRLNEDLVNLRAGSSVVVENDAAKYFEHAALAHFPAPG